MLQKTPDRVRILGEFADYMETVPPNKFVFEKWCGCIAGHAIKKFGSVEDRLYLASGVYLYHGSEAAWPFDTAKELLHLTKDEAWTLFVHRHETFGTYEVTPKMAAAKVRELMCVEPNEVSALQP